MITLENVNKWYGDYHALVDVSETVAPGAPVVKLLSTSGSGKIVVDVSEAYANSIKVGDKALKGIDLIQFDAQGLIVDFEVMVRPMSGLQALGAEMGQRLAAFLPAYQASNIK